MLKDFTLSSSARTTAFVEYFTPVRPIVPATRQAGAVPPQVVQLNTAERLVECGVRGVLRVGDR